MLTDDLLELQGLDTSIDQLTHRRARLPEREAAAGDATALAAADRRRVEVVARAEELELAIAASEAAGEQVRTQRVRLEGQLRTVTSMRAAEAIEHELQALAARQDVEDDQELANLEEQSGLQAEQAELDGTRPALAATAAGSAAALGAAEGALDAEVAGLATRRQERAGRLPASELERYERLRARFGGVAVARLEGTRCSGCHLDLSAAEVEAVRATPSGEFAECPQCGRLLVS